MPPPSLEDMARYRTRHVRYARIVRRSASLDKLAFTAHEISIVLGDAVSVQDDERIGRKRNDVVRSVVLWEDA